MPPDLLTSRRISLCLYVHSIWVGHAASAPDRYDANAFRFDKMKEEVADAVKEDWKRASLSCLVCRVRRGCIVVTVTTFGCLESGSVSG